MGIVDTLDPSAPVDELIRAMIQDGQLSVVGFDAQGDPIVTVRHDLIDDDDFLEVI